MALCAQMLLAGGLESERQQALGRCDEAVTSGRAAEIFDRMCVSLGGPADFVRNSSKHLPAAPAQRAVHTDGYLQAVDVRAVGNVIIELGGGRRQVGEALNLAVGLSHVAPIGTLLDQETPLAIVHAATEDDASYASGLLLTACTTGPEHPDPAPVIREILSGKP